MEEFLGSGGMLDLYLYESIQLLEQMEAISLSESSNDFFDGESINEIFRIMHTIKSSAAIMMYDNITIAAHKLEDIFYFLRETYCEPITKNELTKYIFLVHDFILEELNKIKKGQYSDGDPSYILVVIESFLKKLKTDRLEGGGYIPQEIFFTEPEQFYIAPAAEAGKLQPLTIDLGFEPKEKHRVYMESANEENLIGISLHKLKLLVKGMECLTEELDKIPDEVSFGEVRNGLGEITENIREAVYTMYNVPMENMFHKARRIVYDASHKLGKRINLQTYGKELEINRNIEAHLSEALLHILRNAVDHGIEEKQERIAAGKSPEGEICLEAKVEEGKLLLAVQDDGNGLDKESIFEHAKQIGIIDKKVNMCKYTEKEIYEFITYPGFSTRNSATEYSGRGIGMDIAVKKLNEIDGILRMQSVLGKGTTMIMEIPFL